MLLIQGFFLSREGVSNRGGAGVDKNASSRCSQKGGESRNLIDKVEKAGLTVYWLPPSRFTRRWGFTYHSEPELRIPKYTEEELMRKCGN